MPRSSTRSQTDSETEKANASNRAGTIRDAIRDIQALEAQRSSIGAEIRSIKQTRIKGDLGMKIGDFNAAFRLASLEEESRDEFLDTLKETFQALGVGQQLNFLDAADDAPAASAKLSRKKAVEPTAAPAEETYSEQLARTQQPIGLIKQEEDGSFTDMDTGLPVDPFAVEETDPAEATV